MDLSADFDIFVRDESSGVRVGERLERSIFDERA
jgi:hypothetical protein